MVQAEPSDEPLCSTSLEGAYGSLPSFQSSRPRAGRSGFLMVGLVAGVLGVVLLGLTLTVWDTPAGPESLESLGDLARSGHTLGLKISVPDSEVLVPGQEIRGSIGGYQFVGHVKGPVGSNRLRIATGTSDLAQNIPQSAPASGLRLEQGNGGLVIAGGGDDTSMLSQDPNTQALASAPTASQSLGAISPGCVGACTFKYTAESDKYYPPGTSVSGYINGRFFKGVVTGGETPQRNFNRRVGELEGRLQAEEARRGLGGATADATKKRIDDILARVKRLESKMSEAFAKAHAPKKVKKDVWHPTQISGNVAGFHFHGTLQPAAAWEAHPKPVKYSMRSKQHAKEQKLLQRVEELEKEVKDAT